MTAVTDHIRVTIVDALLDAWTEAERDPAALEAFEAGAGDVSLAEVELDSLLRMELLVALEMEHGAVVSPQVLAEVSSLVELAAYVEGLVAEGAAIEEDVAEGDAADGAGVAVGRATDGGRVGQHADAGRGTTSRTGASTPASTPASTAPATDRPAPRVVRLFRRAFSGSSTVAQLDRLLVRLEGRITPRELAVLAEHRDTLLPNGVPDAYASELERRLDALAQAAARSGVTEPRAYDVERLGPALFHASPRSREGRVEGGRSTGAAVDRAQRGDSGASNERVSMHDAPAHASNGGAGASDGRARRTLLVCFSVVGGRKLFVPLPVLLQHLDDERHDVLLVADPLGTAFRRGVPGLGTTVEQVVRSLERMPLLDEYAEVRVLGCSAGAFPAMLLGRRIRARVTVAASGRFPSERHVATLVSMYLRCTLAALRSPRARVVLAHAANVRRDAAYARRLARLTGARLLAVVDRAVEDRAFEDHAVEDQAVEDQADESCAAARLGHNLFAPLVEHGRLRAFLDRTLLAPVDVVDAEPRRSTFALDA